MHPQRLCSSYVGLVCSAFIDKCVHKPFKSPCCFVYRPLNLCDVGCAVPYPPGCFPGTGISTAYIFTRTVDFTDSEARNQIRLHNASRHLIAATRLSEGRWSDCNRGGTGGTTMSHYQHYHRLSVVEREEEEQELLNDGLSQDTTQAQGAHLQKHRRKAKRKATLVRAVALLCACSLSIGSH